MRRGDNARRLGEVALPAVRELGALLGQLIQKTAAGLVQFDTGYPELFSCRSLHAHLGAAKRRSGGAVHRFAKALLGKLHIAGAVRNGAFDRGDLFIHILRAENDVRVRVLHCDRKAHADAARLAGRIASALLRADGLGLAGDLLRRFGGFVKILFCRAPREKDTLKTGKLRFGGQLAFADGGRPHVRERRDILAPALPAADGKARYARVDQLPAFGEHAAILPAQRRCVPAAAERIALAAKLAAKAALGALAPGKGAHAASAASGGAKRRLHPHGGFDRAARHAADVLKREIGRQENAPEAEPLCNGRALRRIEAEMRVGKKRHLRQKRAENAEQAEIADDDRVHAATLRAQGESCGFVQLVLADGDVEREIRAAAADAAVAYNRLKFTVRDVLRPAAAGQILKAQIYGVRAALYGGGDGLRRSGGSEQFDHNFFLVNTVPGKRYFFKLRL